MQLWVNYTLRLSEGGWVDVTNSWTWTGLGLDLDWTLNLDWKWIGLDLDWTWTRLTKTSVICSRPAADNRSHQPYWACGMPCKSSFSSQTCVLPGRTHMSMFANNALLGVGLGFGLENKERSKEEGKYAQKNAGLQRNTLWGHRWLQVSVPLNSRPVAYFREGRTTPHLRFVFIEVFLFEVFSSWLAFTVLWIYSS